MAAANSEGKKERETESEEIRKTEKEILRILARAGIKPEVFMIEAAYVTENEEADGSITYTLTEEGISRVRDSRKKNKSADDKPSKKSEAKTTVAGDKKQQIGLVPSNYESTNGKNTQKKGRGKNETKSSQKKHGRTKPYAVSEGTPQKIKKTGGRVPVKYNLEATMAYIRGSGVDTSLFFPSESTAEDEMVIEDDDGNYTFTEKGKKVLAEARKAKKKDKEDQGLSQAPLSSEERKAKQREKRAALHKATPKPGVGFRTDLFQGNHEGVPTVTHKAQSKKPKEYYWFGTADAFKQTAKWSLSAMAKNKPLDWQRGIPLTDVNPKDPTNKLTMDPEWFMRLKGEQTNGSAGALAATSKK